MRERYLEGDTQSQIARDYGTSQGYISNVILGKVWKVDDGNG
jgi:hypothetical protein